MPRRAARPAGRASSPARSRSRTGLTTVGQAGADVGMPAQAATIASALKAQGYATGQFGKNHLGDLNKFLPTLHGFDEFFGYLYHLDAMSDPYWYSFPDDQSYRDKVGPRNLVHSFATDTDDTTEHAALGQDRQAEDRGRRPVGALPRHVQRAEHARHHAQGQIRHGAPSTRCWSRLRATSWTKPRRTASRSSSGTTRRACTSGRSCRQSTRR